MSDYGFFDGACEPRNPGGTGGWGFVLFSASGEKLTESFGLLRAKPSMTNNVAEYIAAGCAVKAYRELGRDGPLLLHGDSQLVVKQMQGQWQVRSGAYIRVYDRLRSLLTECGFTVQWKWVPREKNQLADDLSKKALVDAGIRIPERRSKRRRR